MQFASAGSRHGATRVPVLSWYHWGKPLAGSVLAETAGDVVAAVLAVSGSVASRPPNSRTTMASRIGRLRLRLAPPLAVPAAGTVLCARMASPMTLEPAWTTGAQGTAGQR